MLKDSLFTNDEVAEYYNTTQNHYETWWGLKDHYSLHYGIWEAGIRSFGESVRNTNRIIFDTAEITSKDRVLDAGCGVGGAALYIHQRADAHVTGITLSEKQFQTAQSKAQSLGVLHDGVDFEMQDFTNTSYEDESFDVIWACESVCHAVVKSDFIREAFRLLKPGGRLVMCDFFVTEKGLLDDEKYIRKWQDTWGVDNYQSIEGMKSDLSSVGFSVSVTDYTDAIHKSSRRMYQAALLGVISSELYNLFNPKVSRFARDHYKCGYYQYKALKAGLWQYAVFLGRKGS